MCPHQEPGPHQLRSIAEPKSDSTNESPAHTAERSVHSGPRNTLPAAASSARARHQSSMLFCMPTFQFGINQVLSFIRDSREQSSQALCWTQTVSSSQRLAGYHYHQGCRRTLIQLHRQNCCLWGIPLDRIHLTL